MVFNITNFFNMCYAGFTLTGIYKQGHLPNSPHGMALAQGLFMDTKPKGKPHAWYLKFNRKWNSTLCGLDTGMLVYWAILVQLCASVLSIIIQIINVYECNGTNIFMR